MSGLSAQHLRTVLAIRECDAPDLLTQVTKLTKCPVGRLAPDTTPILRTAPPPAKGRRSGAGLQNHISSHLRRAAGPEQGQYIT